MSLIKLLQEASALSLQDLKKAMQKDSSVAAIFKNDLSLSKIDDPKIFLTSLKYWLLNNENVKLFVASRNNVDTLGIASLSEFRKLQADDLNENKLIQLQSFVKDVFREYSKVSKGTLSRETRKALDSWVNGSSKGVYLSRDTRREILSVPDLRPTKKIVVYRGLLFSHRSLTNSESYDGTIEKGDGLKFLDSIRKGKKEVDLHWDDVSSWTTNKEIAEKFAKYGAESSSLAATMNWLSRMSKNKAIDGELGFVISTLADPADILISIDTYSETEHHVHGDEGEIILLPGTYHSKIIKKFTVDGEQNIDTSSSDASSSVAINKVIDDIKQFNVKDLVPSAINSIELHNTQLVNALEDKTSLKKLLLTSTTTSAVDAMDKLIKFYKKNLADIDATSLSADKFTDPDLRNTAEEILKLIKIFSNSVRHSSLASEQNVKGTGTLAQLTATAYRQTLVNYDLSNLESEVNAGGKFSRQTSSIVERIAKLLNVTLDARAPLKAHSASNQKEFLTSVAEAFFKYINVDAPAGSNVIVSMINLLKRATRNSMLLATVRLIQTQMEKISGDSKE